MPIRLDAVSESYILTSKALNIGYQGDKFVFLVLGNGYLIVIFHNDETTIFLDVLLNMLHVDEIRSMWSIKGADIFQYIYEILEWFTDQ